LINPANADVLFSLGTILEKQGDIEEAKVQFEKCLEIDCEDTCGARFMLASLGCGAMPDRAPEALLDKLYKERAGTWTSCRGTELVADKLMQSISCLENPNILDAGCGTGYIGELVHNLAIPIDGIDMSNFMLQKARHKGVYKNLFHGDMVSFMAERPEHYDVVTCAATLIHFGDLHKVFEAAAITLRDNGCFIFSLFKNEKNEEDVVIGTIDDDYASGGCYAHSHGHVIRSATASGFMVEQLETDVHEYHKQQPIMGLIVVLRRQPRNIPLHL